MPKISLPNLRWSLASVGLLLLVSGCAASGLKVARNTRALVPIVVAADAIPAETTAAQELSTYLEKISGARFATIKEQDLPAGANAIYVGQTAFARSHGIDVARLGAEDARLRTVDGNLVLTGGRPRGTLYAVYTLLEDVLGCRWYSPWVEKVPARPTCIIPPLDRLARPAFALRSSYTCLPDPQWDQAQIQQWYRYLVRNRLNDADASATTYWTSGRIWYEPKLIPGGDRYGGCAGLRYPNGPPHTFALEFPAQEYFAQHPDWFSERNGQRVPANGSNGNHLCLTNPELRRAYIAKLKEHMRQYPFISLFAVSMNDGGCQSPCDCAACTAFAAKSSWSDLYCDFLNELAEGIKTEFPHNRIWTLAYSFAANPPRQVKPRDNVVVMACLLNSNQVTIPESAGGRPFANPPLAAWAKITAHLQVWDYLQNGPPYYFLAPVYFRMQAQYRYCRQLGVTGVFAENELGVVLNIVPEFYPLRLWLYSKLLQDPDQDLMALIRDFMNGYYGAAGPFFSAYITLQHDRLAQWPHRMVDLAFVNQMQTWHDQAEAAVKDQPAVRARVRDARIWADLTTLFFKTKLASEFVQHGGRLEYYPYKSAMLKERLLTRLKETQSPFWQARFPSPYPNGPRRTLADLTQQYVERLALGNDDAPLPKQFADLPAERVIDIPGYQLSRCDKGELVDDPDSVFGVAAARLTAQEMPVGMGVYDYTQGPRGRLTTAKSITAAEIPGKGYHVYPVGRTTISINSLFYFSNSWEINQKLEMFYDPMNMGQEWDVYVSAKIVTSPFDPPGNPNAKAGVYIDRLLLVKVAK